MLLTGREPGKTLSSPASQIHQRSGMETLGGVGAKVEVYVGVDAGIEVAVDVSVNI